MKLNFFKTLVTSVLLLITIVFSFRSSLPSSRVDREVTDTEFSVENALQHVKIISEKPHYIGSEAHTEVRDYLMTQLEILGLEPHLQTGFVINEKWNVLARPQNIVARLRGSSSQHALMLLAHYDSAPHSFSLGASDAGSGVAAVLESLRAYLTSGRTPKNDIIILFSDAEEIGLLGAKLFVKHHPWINDVSLVVNFEARGSGGPASMILETTGGNKTLIQEFVASKPSHPFASSLFYSIYKMLPNDTDSTVFREDAQIDSYFFAFIDDHFDYHTANDTYENLDRSSLKHHGSYAMAMLDYFSDSDISNLKSEEDYVYFNFPGLSMVSYPFSWIVPMLVVAWVLFFVIVGIGFTTRKLELKMLLKGCLVFLKSLAVSGILVFGLWQLLGWIYPGYQELLHGFTYNGSYYILTFTFFTLGWFFWFYRKYNHEFSIISIYVFPILVWLVINTLIAVYLPGAAYFIIPVYLALLTLLLLVVQSYKRQWIYILLSLPTLFLFVPLVRFFPVGLGLKMLFASALFTVLIFGLLIPVLVSFKGKRGYSLVFFLLSLVFLITAHFTSSFSPERPKPNSLVYFHDLETETAFWATYDRQLDDWTESFINPQNNQADQLHFVPGSKYGTGFEMATPTTPQKIESAVVVIESDSLVGNYRDIEVSIYPKRKINRLVMYSQTSVDFIEFSAQGERWRKNPETGTAFTAYPHQAFLSYYLAGEENLHLRFRVDKNADPQLLFQEISFDLTTHESFDLPVRGADQMPKPFVTTDAIIVQQKIKW